jgi:hypothetical protein
MSDETMNDVEEIVADDLADDDLDVMGLRPQPTV